MTDAGREWDVEGFRHGLQKVLDETVDRHAERLAPLGDDVPPLVDEARALLSGGKRLRASFCWWGFHAVREPDDPTALLRACASLEILHASALVHDDVMDGSDTRRGRAATHVSFAAVHRERGWQGDPAAYGAATAILLGDLLLSWSDELLRHSGLPADRVMAGLDVFDETRSEVIAGQFLDVTAQASGTDDVERSMRVLRYKSAKYSVERPLHLGATLAGGDDRVQRALREVGLPLGEAFQLRDDLLGVFGDPGATGKPAGDDLVEGKRTVLVALAAAGASSEDAALLRGGIGADLSEADVDVLRAVIERTGAAAEVEQMIDDLTGRALAALDAAPVTDAARSALRDLARAATARAV